MFELIGILFLDFSGPEVPESFGYEADPDSLPEPGFEGMFFSEIAEVLDEQAREAWELEQNERILWSAPWWE